MGSMRPYRGHLLTIPRQLYGSPDRSGPTKNVIRSGPGPTTSSLPSRRTIQSDVERARQIERIMAGAGNDVAMGELALSCACSDGRDQIAIESITGECHVRRP